MISLNRVIVSRGNNKIDFTGNVPSPADNNNVKVVDLEKNTATPVINELSLGNTTLRYTNIKNKQTKPFVVVKAGTYTTAFSEGGSDVTYKLERIGNKIKVTGTIKYVDANANVGLAAGNHVILDFKHPNIANTSALPSDNPIVKVTHTEIEGNYNTAARDAFETDGSLVVAVNLSTAKSLPLSEPREVIIAWTKEGDNLVWEHYLLDFSEAKLGASN